MMGTRGGGGQGGGPEHSPTQTQFMQFTDHQKGGERGKGEAKRNRFVKHGTGGPRELGQKVVAYLLG